MFILGLNYWPRRSSLAMLREASTKEIEEDLSIIKDIGFNSVRAFLLLRDVVDPDFGIKEDALRVFKSLLEAAERIGLNVYPTLITIHMSGCNWFNPFLKGSIYSLDTLNEMQEYLMEVVSKLRNYSSVKGWVLTNEISLVEAPPNPSCYKALVRSLAAVVKYLDGKPIGLGDITFFVPGTDPESIETLPLDFVDLHIYYYDNDDVRQSLAYSALASLYQSLGKPVIVEEFGCSTYVFDEESHARFVNAVLHSLLANGVNGAFIWCYADYVDVKEKLLENHPYEMGFGVVRKDGSLKPIARVIREFRKLLNALEKEGFWSSYRARRRDVAIILTKLGWGAVPFIQRGRDIVLLSSLECFTIFKLLGAPTTLVPEHKVKEASHRLFILPSIIIASCSTWRALASKVVEGSVVYSSIVRIDAEAHKGACHLWFEIFGVKPKLKCCRIGKNIGQTLSITFINDFGSIAKGTEIKLPIGNRIKERILTWEFEPVEADVVAQFEDGSPAIALRKLGKGYAVLSVAPLEAALASMDVVDRLSREYLNVLRFYESLLELARVERLFLSNDPRVEVEYYLDDGKTLVFVVNHSFDYIEASLALRGLAIKDVEVVGGDARVVGVEAKCIKLDMPPKSAIVIKVLLEKV